MALNEIIFGVSLIIWYSTTEYVDTDMDMIVSAYGRMYVQELTSNTVCKIDDQYQIWICACSKSV